MNGQCTRTIKRTSQIIKNCVLLCSTLGFNAFNNNIVFLKIFFKIVFFIVGAKNYYSQILASHNTKNIREEDVTSNKWIETCNEYGFHPVRRGPNFIVFTIVVIFHKFYNPVRMALFVHLLTGFIISSL